MREIIVFDGGMGTLLQSNGLPSDIPPELWNIENPDVIERIQRNYAESGAQVLTTNTFGASKLKLSAYGLENQQAELIKSAVEIAKRASLGKNIAIAGDIGPLGIFLQPFGELTFDSAYHEFSEYAVALAKSGVDLIIIETMTDILELKAAILAVKDATNLPVIASFSFDEGDCSVTGTPPDVYAITIDALVPDALGTNCGKGILPVIDAVKKMRPYTARPIIAQPNAGLPKVKNGKTLFPATPSQMAVAAVEMWELGANIIGSCCGSTPEHTAKIADSVRGKTAKKFDRKRGFFVTSRVNYVHIADDEPVRIIGERINPSGRKKFSQKIQDGDIGTIKLEAVRQSDADILDICIAAPNVDEEKMLQKAVSSVSNIVNQPLFIDSTDIDALNSAMKVYPGLPVINSISGKSADIERLCKLAKRWGAGFVALALDDDGIPNSVDGRVAVLRKIIDYADSLDISRNRIIADPIMLPVSADFDNPEITLKSIELIARKLKIPTVIGLSNVSYGLPARSIVNSAMLAIAINSGLSAVIADPTDSRIIEILYAAQIFANKDDKASKFIGKFEKIKSPQSDEMPTESLREDILRGNSDWVPRHIEEELKKSNDPLTIMNEIVIPAIREVGDKYEHREIYLPQVIAAAEATTIALKILKPMFSAKDSEKGKILVATVYGDVHDIGKNLVKALLESHGFDIVDLGKNVKSDRIIEALSGEKFFAVGLSALMTTTLPAMERTVLLIHREFPELPVIIGGAAVCEEFAQKIDANYAKDAVNAAKIADRLCLFLSSNFPVSSRRDSNK